MNKSELLSIVTQSKDWRRVSNLPCVHTFFDSKYYINLCKYKNQGVQTISLNIDDVVNNISDLLEQDYPQGSEEFNILSPIYDNAIIHGTQIRTERPLILEAVQ